MTLPLLLTRSQAAALLGVSARTFDRHVRPGILASRVGGCVRFARSEIERWADELAAGRCDGARGARTRSGSSSADGATNSDLARAIHQKLTAARLARTRTRSEASSTRDPSDEQPVATVVRLPRRSRHG